MNPKAFQCHSGGAKGADMAWDQIGQEYGFPKAMHWRPEDYDRASDEIKEQIDQDVKAAALALKRPDSFTSIKLVKRNWFQVENAQAIFAIGRIVWPGEKDSRNYVNETDHMIVEGGTGWAVEMALQKQKPIYVFNLVDDKWYQWKYLHNRFYVIDTPTLYERFAGIGSRVISEIGRQAIRDVYENTLKED